jgi:lipid-A-disaccharide synthase
LANFPHQLDVALRILRAFPETSFLLPTTPATDPVVRGFLSRAEADLQSRATVAEGQFDSMVPRCDLCITVSGTATLHVAGWGVPMVVVYRGNPFLWHLVARWLVKTRTYSLVNLLTDARRHIVPEFIPWYGSNAPVADYAMDMLRHPEKLDEQRVQLRRLVHALDKPGASMNAAKLAMDMMVSDQKTPMTVGR